MTSTPLRSYGESRYIDSTQRRDAFHTLGTDLDPSFTAAEVLDFAKLANWNVRKVGLQTVPMIEGEKLISPLDVPGAFVTVRDSPFTGEVEVISKKSLGKVYTPIQNEAHVELLDTLVDQSGAHFETAGANADGTEAFVAMKMPETMLVGGVDRVDTYITGFNSHDGSSSFRFTITPVRVRCANMQSMALRQAVSTYSIRHTKNSTSALQQVREALGLTFKFEQAFEVEAQAMYEEAMTERQFKEIIDTIWVPDDAAPQAQQDTAKDRADTLMHLFLESPTNEEIRGTHWAGYQAFTEWTDHYATIRGKRGDALVEARARNAITDSTARWVKHRAFDLLSV